MQEQNILNIKKLKVECNSCNTVVICDIGKSIYECPACSQSFEVKQSDNYYLHLKRTLEKLKSIDSATFSLICEEEV